MDKVAIRQIQHIDYISFRNDAIITKIIESFRWGGNKN